MKKMPAILEELWIWVRGRFTLTGEEKVWLLLILIVLWVGLVARYTHLKNRQPQTLSPQEVQAVTMKNE